MKLTETPPVRCSACFGQYVDRQHVDFEAAWEGPTFREGIAGEDGEVRNTINVSVDDLILCADCLRAGAKLLGMVDDVELLEALEAAETQRDELLERVRGFEEYTKNLEASIASQPLLAGVRG